MKRDIFLVKGPKAMDSCCPGHDDWPCETYKSNRSKRARSRDKKKEHRYARHILNRRIEEY